jgi:hypothetical protein
MPGATSLGIRYPFQGETVTATSWQNTANDIDGLLTQLDVLRDTSISKLSASISGGTVATATGATGVATTFTNENWDTGGYADLVANNDRLTVTPGVYWTQCRAILTTVTTITSARCGVLVGGAVLWNAITVDTIGGTNVACNSTGIVVVTLPATIFQVQVRWVGTGGPGTWTNVRLEAYKVRDFANV